MLPLANVIEDAFSPLISAFESIMVFIHDNVVGGSWGLAIIGLTVVIRALLVPLTFRQLKSMQEMQRLAPHIQALKEKYKDDKQRQQQEIMTFYREHKINPLASCLPLLLQLPVFISLFYMLRTDLKLDICGKQMREFYSQELGKHIVSNSQIPQNAVTVPGHVGKVPGLSEIGCSTPFHLHGASHTIAPGSAKFLFIPDITFKATGAVLIVLLLVYVASQVASTLVATATADPNQRRIMLVLPIVFVLFLYRFPAGLLVYWITTNTWTIGQQLLIKRHMGSIAPPGGAGTDGRLPDGKAKAPAAGPRGEPALAGVGGSGSTGGGASSSSSASSGGGSGRRSAPPPPPRKKKKRSGRRR
jgi:YidC/Oxa1 family membrane protein insertase